MGQFRQIPSILNTLNANKHAHYLCEYESGDYTPATTLDPARKAKRPPSLDQQDPPDPPIQHSAKGLKDGSENRLKNQFSIEIMAILKFSQTFQILIGFSHKAKRFAARLLNFFEN